MDHTAQMRAQDLLIEQRMITSDNNDLFHLVKNDFAAVRDMCDALNTLLPQQSLGESCMDSFDGMRSAAIKGQFDCHVRTTMNNILHGFYKSQWSVVFAHQRFRQAAAYFGVRLIFADDATQYGKLPLRLDLKMFDIALHTVVDNAFKYGSKRDTQEMRCRGSLLTALAQCTVGGILASTELTLAGLITFGYFCWNKLLLCSHSKRVQWRWQQQSSILYMYMIWGIVEYVIVLRDPVGASAVTVVAKTTWAVMPLLSLGLSPGWWHVSWLQKSFATLLLTCVAACWQVMLVAQHDQRAAGDAAGNCASIRADEMLLRGGIMVLSAMLARRSERRRRLAFLAQALHQQQAADEHPGNHVFQNADGNIDELLQIPVVLSFIDQALEDSFRAHRLSACLPHARLCLIMLVASVYCSIARYIDVERAHSGLDLQCCMGALHLMAVVAWTRITATQQISMQAIGMGMMWVSQFIVLLLCVRQQQSLLLATDHSSTAAASFGLVYHLLGGVAGLCWVHVFIFGLMWHHGALCGAVGLVLHIACWGLQSGTPEDTKLLLGAPPTISSAVSASVLEERHRLLMGVTIGCVFVHALTCMLSHHVEELERESFRCHREQVSSSTDKASAKQGQQHDEHAGNQLERQEQQQESQQDQEDMLKDSSAMHGLALHFKYHSWEETFWQQAVQDTQEMRCRGSLLTALAQCTVGVLNEISSRTYQVKLQVMTVTQLLWQQAEEFGIRTELASPEIPDELEVSFDTNVLAIVMSNLVSNAHKYGGKDAHPSLVAEVLEQHQGTLRLSLWNSPGPNHGQFQRSNLQMLLSSAGNSGTFLSDGIGLTSIQKCMDCAGWTLELEIDSEGTTFVIYIPQAMHRPDTFLVDKHQQPLLMKTGNDPKHCQAQPHHPAVQLQPPEMSGASEQLNSGTAQSTNVLADMRVVVLDDSALVRRIYGHALKSMGVREWWVLGETREEILGFPKFVMAHAVDIIVLDQAFDEVLTRAECASVNGVTLLAELKQMGFKGFCATRTSHAEGNEKAYQESGFDAVLPKKGSLKQQLVENWQTWYKIQLNEQYIVNSSAMHGLALHFKYHSWEEAFWQQAVQDTQEMRCRGSLLTALAQCTVG
eukprot:gene19788-23665_t